MNAAHNLKQFRWLAEPDCHRPYRANRPIRAHQQPRNCYLDSTRHCDPIYMISQKQLPVWLADFPNPRSPYQIVQLSPALQPDSDNSANNQLRESRRELNGLQPPAQPHEIYLTEL